MRSLKLLTIPILMAASAFGLFVYSLTRTPARTEERSVAVRNEQRVRTEPVSPRANEQTGMPAQPQLDEPPHHHAHPRLAADDAGAASQLFDADGALHPVFEEFEGWIEDFAGLDPANASDLITEGVELAARRERLMVALIVTDPERALNTAVPARVAKELPSEIAEHLERQVSGLAAFDVMALCNEEAHGIERSVTLDGATYQAFVYGARSEMTTKESVALHGIVIGNTMAVHESPIRVLAPGEEPDSGLEMGDGGGRARDARGSARSEGRPLDINPVGSPRLLATPLPSGSGRSAPPPRGEVLGIAGHTIMAFPDAEALAALNSQLSAEQNTPGPSVEVLAAGSSWSTGPKTVLFMKTIFADENQYPVSEVEFQKLIKDSTDYFARASFGRTSVKFTVTSLLKLPKTYAQYPTSMGSYRSMVASDAQAAAAKAGYKIDEFDLWVVASGGSGGGFAMVGARGCWVGRTPDSFVVKHELGHNYGLMHANGWVATTEDPLGPGRHQEYGNFHDTMGVGGGDFNGAFKAQLNWIEPAGVATANKSGEFRIYALEQDAPDGAAQVLLVQASATGNSLYVDYRENLSAATIVRRTSNQLLWPEGVNILRAGRTVALPLDGIFITVVRVNPTTPSSIDVHVGRGPFPGNRPPVLAVTASKSALAVGETGIFAAQATDPDGDALHYDWRMNEYTPVQSGSPEFRQSWQGNYHNTVKCVVTDGKGGRASADVVVKVGNSPYLSVSGRVTNHGVPVEGAMVWWQFSTRFATTASDGTYSIQNFSASQSVSLVAVKSGGITLVPENFANPFVITSHRPNLNFDNEASTPPVVSVAADPLAGSAPLAVSFDATATDSDGTIVSYAWDFGDGSPAANTEDVVHEYTRSGSFLASITVTDNDGASASATALVQVAGGSLVDLALGSPKAGLTKAGKISVAARVRNNGSVATAGGLSLTAFLSADAVLDATDPLVGERLRAKPLKANSAWSASFAATPPAADPGEYFVIAFVDAQDNVAEASESNNMAVLGPVSLLPNLRVERMAVRLDGKDLSLEVEIGNQGCARVAGDVKVAVCLSKDPKLSDDDVRVVSVETASSGLNPGESKDLLLAGKIPAGVPTGRYIVLLVVDPENAIAETNEKDNAKSGAGRVAVP